MYPRNAASPEPIGIGAVIQISDGAVQTAGVTVRIKPIGVTEADGAGATAYSTDGIILYTPTQAETNYTSFVLIAKKTNCIPASITVVTSASATPGHAGTDQGKIANPNSTVNLSGTTIKNATDNASQTSLDTLDDYVDTEVAAIKAKTDLIVAFPANFSLLSIGGGGEITNVALVDELGASALSANGAGDEVADYVWGALLADHQINNSFGARIVRSVNSNNEVEITGGGSHHIFAVIHDSEPNSIHEDAFDAGAISATVLATSAAEKIADAAWDEAISAHLGSGSTGEALNNAGGSGNPWITDIATGYTGTQAGNILNQVKAKTDLITSGTAIQTTIPVTAQGQITGPLYIGDDYLTANGRQFDWTVALPSGFVAGTSTCKFGMVYEDETGVASFNVAGTVADVGSGNVRLRFELPRATTETLKAGFYRWSVEIASASGTEITRVAYNDRKLVEWREKQT